MIPSNCAAFWLLYGGNRKIFWSFIWIVRVFEISRFKLRGCDCNTRWMVYFPDPGLTICFASQSVHQIGLPRPVQPSDADHHQLLVQSAQLQQGAFLHLQFSFWVSAQQADRFLEHRQVWYFVITEVFHFFPAVKNGKSCIFVQLVIMGVESGGTQALIQGSGQMTRSGFDPDHAREARNANSDCKNAFFANH